VLQLPKGDMPVWPTIALRARRSSAPGEGDRQRGDNGETGTEEQRQRRKGSRRRVKEVFKRKQKPGRASSSQSPGRLGDRQILWVDWSHPVPEWA